jgi:hypothetical protein
MHFCMYAEYNLLNTYQSEKYFEQKLYTDIKHTLNIPQTFSVSLAAFILTEQIGHYVYIQQSSTTPKARIICVFQLLICPFPFINMDNHKYTICLSTNEGHLRACCQNSFGWKGHTLLTPSHTVHIRTPGIVTRPIHITISLQYHPIKFSSSYH